MAKVACECSYIFHLGGNDPFSYSFVPDKNIEDVLSLTDTAMVDGEQLALILDRNAKPALLCPQCGRILIEFKSGVYQSYKRDDKN